MGLSVSKILETLRASEKDISSEKSTYEMTQEQLASIYFPSANKEKGAKPELPAPIIIRVVEKQKLSSLIPWVIASVAFLITALSLFSTKRVFIDVKMIDEKNPYLATFEEARFTQNLPAPRAVERELSGDETVMEKISHESFIFEGAAKLKSSKDKQTLTLVNSSVAPFARASFYFDVPADLTNAKIVFYVKGAVGGERLAVAVKDEENILAFRKGKIFPIKDPLTVQWQRAEISFNDAAPNFDKHKVKSLRLDFGSKDTENKSGDTIFVKELQIVRQKNNGNGS